MNISKKSNLRPTIENQQARFNYELLDDFEAGISLEGWEVKSIRNGQVELKNAYVVLKKGEAFSALFAVYTVTTSQPNVAGKTAVGNCKERWLH